MAVIVAVAKGIAIDTYLTILLKQGYRTFNWTIRCMIVFCDFGDGDRFLDMDNSVWIRVYGHRNSAFAV